MGIFFCVLRNKSKICVALCSFVLFVIIYKYAKEHKNQCSIDASVKRISNLCEQYSKNKIFGNMCPILCQSFHLTKCLGKSTGKHVSMVECNGCLEQGKKSRIILKGGHNFQNDILQSFKTLTNTNDKLALIRKVVMSKTKQLFGGKLSKDTDMVRYILGDDVHELVKTDRSDTKMDQVLNLTLTHVLEDEFLSLKVLGPKPFLPKFYGICGDSYLVEYTPSLLNQAYIFDYIPDLRNIKLHLPSWKERAKLALQFLDLILKVENTYKYPMHICDIKGDNLGVNPAGEVILLDSDGVRFNGVYERTNCSYDKHCSFVNCKGVCNQTTHTCSPYMASNNLQNICRLIFLSKWKHLGLLRHPPYAIRTELSELLHECINPRENVFVLATENKSDKKVLFALKSLFQKSLRSV